MKKLVAIKTGSSIFFVFAIIFILGLSISLQSLLADWTVPTNIPPQGNALKPVNIGTSTEDIQTVLGMFGASTIAATGNLGANKVITPELCLGSGDDACKTTWPEGGSGSSGSSVRVWVNDGNAVSTKQKYEIANPFGTTSVNVQIYWTDVKSTDYLRKTDWQQDYWDASHIMTLGPLVNIKSDKIEIYSGGTYTYNHSSFDTPYGENSTAGYYLAEISTGSGGSSGSGEGDTMVPGWPDAITCNITDPNYANAILYLETSANVMWYVMPYNPEDVRITFNLDGTFNNKYGITTTDCQGLSISQLYSQGKAFNFVGGGSSGTPGPSFSVHKNGTVQSIPAMSAHEKITWSTERFDTNSNFSSNTFTPTAAGKYILTSSILFGDATVPVSDNWNYMAMICKNGYSGECKVGSMGLRTASNQIISSVSAVFDANGTTDYFEVYVATNGNAVNVHGGSNYTFFTGSMVGSGGSGTSGSVPAGTISAFNLTTCPTGWTPADGTNSTPDLRGVFIRGMETFDDGTSYNDRDPDRSGAGTLDSYQADMFASHYHSFPVYATVDGALITRGSSGGAPYAPTNTSSSGGNETRPKNVALIYCMKTNTETPQVSLWTKNNSDVYYNEGNVAIGTTSPFTYNGDVERNLVIYSPTASRNTNLNMVYNGGTDYQGSIIEATNLSNTYTDKRIAQINLYNPLGSDQNKGVIEFLVWDDGTYNTTLKINKTGLEVNGDIKVPMTSVGISNGDCKYNPAVPNWWCNCPSGYYPIYCGHNHYSPMTLIISGSGCYAETGSGYYDADSYMHVRCAMIHE